MIVTLFFITIAAVGLCVNVYLAVDAIRNNRRLDREWKQVQNMTLMILLWMEWVKENPADPWGDD